MEDVEAADEWFEEHAEAGGEAGGNTADSREIDGVETGSSKQTPLSPSSSSLPGTSSPPTAQPTTPTPAVSQPPPSSIPAASGVVVGEPPPTTQPTAQPTPPLAVPPGVQRTPIAAIDRFIREGYIAQEALEDIMKHNFNGRAYRKEVTQRRALFEARQPPFDNIPADFGGGVVGGGGVGGASENTHILEPSPSPSSQQPAANPPQPTQPTTFPDTFTAARNEPDAEVLQSLKNSLESDYNTDATEYALKHAITVIKPF